MIFPLKPRSRKIVKAKVRVRKGKIRIITPDEVNPVDGPVGDMVICKVCGATVRDTCRALKAKEKK